MADRAANPNLTINTILRRIRFYLDEPVDDKYTDNDLLDLVVSPALQEVWGYLHNTSDNPIVASFSIDVDSSTKEYQLPPSVQNVHNLVRLDSQGEWVYEYRPRGKHNIHGPMWFLEGNILRFDPALRKDETLTLYYTPTPDQPMHYATDGQLFGDLVSFKLSDSPELGWADLRENGYVGCVIRLIGANVIETRIVSAHDPHLEEPQNSSSSGTADPPENNIITVRRAFTRNTIPGTYAYEIFPPGSAAFTEAIALASVLKLGAQRGVSAARMRLLMDQFRQARRTEAQRLENMLSRTGKSIERSTIDNPDLGLQNLYGAWWVP
jgi:hypothetical protein